MNISIVAGTYNRISSLQTFIDSVRSSIGVGIIYEIIIVDGGSTDGTISWCEKQRDIKLIQQGKLLGAVKAFNEGFQNASGEYVIIANDDIEFIGDSILIALAYMMDNSSCGIGCFYQDRNNKSFHVSRMVATRQVDKKRILVNYGQVCIVPKWLGDKVGWWGDYLYTYGGDNELSCNILELGYTVSAIPCACIHDSKLDDELRAINTQKVKRKADSDAWTSKWYHSGKYGAMIPHSLVECKENDIVGKKRILYMPIFSKSNIMAITGKKGLRNALTRKFIVYEHDYVNDGVSRISSLIESFEPNVILMQVHDGYINRISSENIREWKSICGSVIINWNGDYRPNLTENVLYTSFLKELDHALFVSEDHREFYESEGIKYGYWQTSCEDVEYTDIPGHEVVFQGNCYSDVRKSLGNVLDSIATKTDVGIYGSGWNVKYAKMGNTHYNFSLAASIYRNSVISISDQQWPAAKGYVSSRMYHALASGSLVFQQNFAGLEEYTGFQPGKHLITFNSYDELPALVHWYLWKSDDAKYIADAGRKHLMENHTFDHRVDELLKMVYGEIDE